MEERAIDEKYHNAVQTNIFAELKFLSARR